MPILELPQKREIESKNKPKFKCPICKCRFFTEVDLEYHKKIHIRKTRSGEGEIFPLKLYPELASYLIERKTLKIGEYNYTLLRDGETVYRWRD